MSQVQTAQPEPEPQVKSPGYESHTHGRKTIVSNTVSGKDIQAQMEADDPDFEDPEKKVKDAASELGKKGAEARKAAAEEAEKQKKKDPRDRSDPNRRINTITREKKEAEERAAKAETEREEARKESAAVKARAEAAERRAAEAEARVSPAVPSQVTPRGDGPPLPSPRGAAVVQDEAPPDRQKFPAGPQGDDQWLRAYHQDAIEKAEKRVLSKLNTERQGQAYAQGVAATLAPVHAALKKQDEADPEWSKRLHPEVLAVSRAITPARDPKEAWPQPKHVIADEIVFAGDKAPQVMLYLSEHPDEFQRIKALPTWQEIQVEMKLIARSLNGAGPTATAPKAQVSKAHPPVRPVTGAPSATDAVPDEKAGYKAHKAYFQKNLGKRR